MHSVRYNRRTNLRVKGGKVQKKNNHQLTAKKGFVVDREPPKRGFTHVVTKRDILEFVELIPDWRNLLYGIERVRLYAGSDRWDGLYRHFDKEGTGCIWLSAWPRELTQEIATSYFNEHRSIFERIELRYEKRKDCVFCWFDEAKAKAFILVHVFLHELGHHLDSMKRDFCASGEPYAEHFAKRLEDEVWLKYVQKFGKP
jgi:hypothetical protein